MIDVVERLREADAEIERLRQQVTELVDVMTWIVAHDRNANPLRRADYHKANCKCWRCAIDNAEAAIAKATGGE